MRDTISQPAYIPEYPNQGPLAANPSLGYGPLPKTPSGPDIKIPGVNVPTGQGQGGYFNSVQQTDGETRVPGGEAVAGPWRPNLWDNLSPLPKTNPADPRGTTSVTNINNVPRDFSPGSREGYGAVGLRERTPESVGPDGQLTDAGIAYMQDPALGWLDANRMWTPAAAQAGAVPPGAVGQPGDTTWLRNPSEWAGKGAPSAPPADAGQPLDPGAVLPGTPAEVAAVENTGGSPAYSDNNYSPRTRSSGNYGGRGGGGGNTYPASGRSRRSSGGSSFGGDEDFGEDWKSFLKDFDGDGDTDSKDEMKAKAMSAKRKKTRRGKRAGKSTSVDFQTTPMREEILSTIEKSRNKGKD
jgi:hypothetical protein